MLEGEEGNQQQTATHQGDLEGNLEGVTHRQPDDEGKPQVEQILRGKKGWLDDIAPALSRGWEG